MGLSGVDSDDDGPSYSLIAHPQAESELKSVPSAQQSRVRGVLDEVSKHRYPADHPKCTELANAKGVFRIRVGGWRAVFTLQLPNLKLLVVGKRDGVYSQDSLDLALNRI